MKSDPAIHGIWGTSSTAIISIQSNANSRAAFARAPYAHASRASDCKNIDRGSSWDRRVPGQYMRYGKEANQEELRIILQRLRDETEEQVCIRLLWVFRRVLLPE